MKNSELKALIKRVVELAMPNMRGYYRVVRKAKVVKTYASDGKYYADVQPLRNDNNVDDSEPVVPKVEIPIIWAGPKRGIICPPADGVHCDLEYYDGDPNYPRISNFRWHGMAAPEVEIGGLIIQQEPGTHIKIDSEHNIIHVTPGGMTNETGENKDETIGGDWTVAVAGNCKIDVTGKADIKAASQASVASPTIAIAGNMTATGYDGGIGTAVEMSNKTHTGSLTLIGPLNVTGDIYASGMIMDGGGNTNHHGH
ncbi:hypothetical protein [uncultured Desulfobacter sp.]|uniref:hypothetical protein n=1 Tax=uncultured Desulfobacter sp. TaxID=240139 RepID=UPI002AAB854C|nr:hypothetical protein [uncultured Desulfobacter sp.]